MRSLQSSANSAAASSPGNVANGLVSGGLVANAGAGWTGANLPTQAANTNGDVTVTVVQTAQNALLNWSSFNVGKSTTLYFNQKAGGSSVGDWIAFNKVSDPSGVPSQILGSIVAEGQVYIINHNGIIFGKGCQVNTHALVASAVPINDSLISSGILDNSNYQFLFDKSLDSSITSCGDVLVEQGAVISCPTTSDNVGGKVILVGENVTNEGAILTPDGQTILAAGSQVGFTAHNSKDSTLRGLDVYIGDSDGTATNSGLIYAPRASVTMAGKAVEQLGVIYCTTSVSLNGRIDLLADYDCISQSTSASTGIAFLPQSTGVVTLGEDSLTAIVPEIDSSATKQTNSLALTSLVNIQGRAIYMGKNSTIYAPGATATSSAVDFVGAALSSGVTLRAGEWCLSTTSTPYTSTFEISGGQVYLDQGASINVAGLVDIDASVAENIISVKLTGAELADYPVQRSGVLYGETIIVDADNGTSVADVSGYVDLINRTVSELSINGGSIAISAGESVVLQKSSVLDVSGGWISYTGATVNTSRLISGGNLYNISNAPDDIVYDKVYTGFTETHAKWGISKTYTSLLINGSYFEEGYTKGGNGGSVTITTPAMVLDGEMYGNTVTGERQRSSAPDSSSLTLVFECQVENAKGSYVWASSALASVLQGNASSVAVTPEIVVGETSDLKAADPFALNAAGDAVALREDRREKVFFSADLINSNGFGNVSIDNSDGNIVIPSDVTLDGAAGGSLTLKAANLMIDGVVRIAGGTMNFTVYDYSPTLATISTLTSTPSSDSSRGNFVLGSSALLDASGLTVDDRGNASALPYVINGGSICINGFDVDLQAGSEINVSGGVSISAASKTSYGTGGAITIEAGRDPGLSTLLGGKLNLGATLLGYGGVKKVTVPYVNGAATVQGSTFSVWEGAGGGTLSIVAPLIQVGGSEPVDTDTLWLGSDFFNKGGFATFKLTGLGKAVTDPTTGEIKVDGNGEYVYTPAVKIAAGTVIAPVVLNHVAQLGSDGSVTWTTVELEDSLRAAVSLAFSAPGVKDSTRSNPLVSRGEVVLEEGASINAGLQGSVAISGQTVDIEGCIYAHGGAISVSGATDSTSIYNNAAAALATLVIGSHAVLDASGAVLHIDDGRGNEAGAVLNGGSISVGGNIAACAGAVLDVSGESEVFDLPVSYFGNASSGVFRSLTHGTEVESNGGTITLKGGQMLYSDATLLGAAGGSSAEGGALIVSSGYYDPAAVSSLLPAALYPSLVIVQSGQEIAASYYDSGSIKIGTAISGGGTVLDPNGYAMESVGHFTVDAYQSGGFDSLTLKGTLLFDGDVTLNAKSRLNLASGGVIYGTGSVKLSAQYVAIGENVLHDTETQSEYLSDYNNNKKNNSFYSPTYGAGVLTVNATLIDVGDLTLRNMGQANFIADNGDIRGSGTLDVAGDIYLRAGQIYPPTQTSFTIAAYDHDGVKGSVTIAASGSRPTPLSAGGEINIYASIINQGGVLRAPDGTIHLGWNGEGDAPVDSVTGLSVNAISGNSYPVTDTVTLLAGSITSVSADGQTVPYGIVSSDGEWIDPSGTDITSSGPVAKTISISGVNIDSQNGASIDLSGGGDLYAYQFIAGNGGSKDVLLSSNSYAIIPSYKLGYGATTAYNTSNTDYYSSDSGYVSSSLKVGETVYLSGCNGLPAGYYTLLPARYALLSGAYLVTLKGGTPTESSVKCSDGSYIVSGYYSNTFGTSSDAGKIYTSFEVASSEVVRNRASYTDYSANDYFAKEAAKNSTITPRLSSDAGALVISALSSFSWSGAISSTVPSGGRGSIVDISSENDILIAGGDTTVAAGTLLLTTSVLNAIDADSILIGGTRDAKANVTVTAETITVDNAGSIWYGRDIILAASKSVTLADGAQIEGDGTLGGSVDTVSVTGGGAVVRISESKTAGVSRTGVSSSSAGSLVIGNGAHVSGASLVLDSANGIALDSGAVLNAVSIGLHSGQISIEFTGQGAADLKTTGGKVTSGLVLSGDALGYLMNSAEELSLVSYSSIDLYGEGTVGNSNYESLNLQAAEIRGFNQGNVTFSAKTITLNNNADASAPTGVDGEGSTLAGNLTFNGEVLKLGTNELTVGNFQTVTLKAAKVLVATGNGEFYAQGNLNVLAPLISGAKSSNETIKSAGVLTVASNEGSADTSYSGLGATLLLEAETVSMGSKVYLPSGNLTVHATSGDVNITGVLDAGGVSKGFYDATAYTDGGTVTLAADEGSVIVGATGMVNVAAQTGGGDAGKLSISAVHGTLSVSGMLKGGAGADNDGGTFSLDTGALSNTGWLDAILNEAGFDYERQYRIRTGDVAVDGYAKSAAYRIAADQGSIVVTGKVDASGDVGGTIFMAAHGSLVLKNGSVLTVAAADFDSAGKGGAVTLEAGDSSLDGNGNYTHDPSALLDIQTGSKIDLSVASATSNSESLGDFTGILHLRAPQTADSSDVQMAPINGEIVGASVVIVEGYKVYLPSGGAIDSVEAAILANGNGFVGAAGSASATYQAMFDRLLKNNQSLKSVVSIRPGAEVVNPTTSSASLLVSLSGNGGAILVPTETKVTFPSSASISVTAKAVITYSDGTTTTLAANTTTTIPAGASITFSSSVGSGSGTITVKSGSAVPVLLPASSTNYFTTTSGSTTLTPTSAGYTVELGKTSSKIAVDKGAAIAFTNGTPGNDKITASVAGTITLLDGTQQTLKANTATAIPVGSTVSLSAAGTITFTSGTGGAICVCLSANHTYTLTGTVYISTSASDLTLGNMASTSSSDWNLATYRFGPDSAPGVLTLRSAGNVVLYNSISDGFATASYSSLLVDANSMLPANSQSWSYRIAAGSDLTGVDFSDVVDVDDLDVNSGSLLLGKYGVQTTSGGGSALTSTAVNGYYQVIRTGSGDIEIYAGRNVKLRNQFATIYTAGTLISDASTIWSDGDFDVPIQNMDDVSITVLGAIQQAAAYKAQYSMGGGNVTIVAGGDIKHETLTSGSTPGIVSDDSEYELPVNWLYRRGYVDSSTGQFGVSYYGDVASTTWWVDFSNFFEGVGALGGGNVKLCAGNDITNVDAVVPTNARMPKGTPDASKLLELGGGDLVVTAGNNINGGVYYVESGDGTLYAGNSILTNATRYPSYTVLTSYATNVNGVTSNSWLPTTLFLGEGDFDISAGGDVLLGPVVNTFLMPEGYNNTYWYKSYFSTYSTSDSVTVSSLKGDITIREGTTAMTTSGVAVGTSMQNILFLYLKNVLLYTTTKTDSYYQPWLRLDESSLTAFSTACSLMPATLKAISFSGDINVVGNLNLSPSPTGTLSLLCAGSVNGLNVTGNTMAGGVTISSWSEAQINLSDADPDSIPGVASPYAYQSYLQTTYGDGFSDHAEESATDFLGSVLNGYFSETGSTEGAAGTLQRRQKLHASCILHASDDEPVCIYAESGDITGFTLFSAKSAQILAGNDITDISFYIQNVRKSDVTIISAGRDLIPYDASSPGRRNVNSDSLHNQFVTTALYPQPGDIQISGPGKFEVLAGRDVDLGSVYTKSSAASDVGVGITSIGNARNPYLPYEGADIVVVAGLNGKEMSYSTFIAQFLDPTTAGNASIYLSEIVPYIEQLLSDTNLTDATDTQIWSAFESLSDRQQQDVALRLFYFILRDAGRNHNDSTSPDYHFESAYAAIAALFPGSGWSGNVSLTHREIKSTHGVGVMTPDGSTVYEGGNISLLVPGGQLEVGYNDTTVNMASQGLITEHGGQISVFSDDNVDVGTSRIFTLRGGDIVIWSTTGDIAAGSSSRTVKSASPTRVLIAPQSANVETDLSGLATGGGIGVLATVSGVEPGSVDLIAPVGTVDAGEAGIRATGNLYVAALQVLNASNIQVGGESVGTAAATTGPSLSVLTNAANTSAAVMNSSDASVAQNSAGAGLTADELPSVITVEVLGYGGGDGEDE